jgi:deoxycytidylate deaminase
MVLIPESEYQEIYKTNEIKHKMKKILKGKHDHEAAKKMSQLMGEVIRRKQTQRQTTPEPDILQHFSRIYHKKVSSFMKLLRENDITWNNQLEVKHIPGSNIVDLIAQALVKSKRKKESLGWQQFNQLIAASNIPISFFTKKATVDDIQKHRHEWEMF